MTLEASADAKATPTSDIDAVLAMPATAALLNLASLCTASDMVMTSKRQAAEAADTTSMLSNAAGSVNNEMTLMPSGLVAVWKDASVSSKGLSWPREGHVSTAFVEESLACGRLSLGCRYGLRFSSSRFSSSTVSLVFLQ